MQKIKRLVIINLILLLLYNILPGIRTIENAEVKEFTEPIYIEEPIESEIEEIIEVEEEYIEIETYSEELVKFVKSKEGFHSEAYIFPGETYYTIGYGTHNSSIKQGQIITESEADRLLRKELDSKAAYVKKSCSYLKLNQSQFDALVSFTYNGGTGMLDKLTANGTRNLEEIKEHITAYTNHGLRGLVIRRNEELDMLNKEV